MLYHDQLLVHIDETLCRAATHDNLRLAQWCLSQPVGFVYPPNWQRALRKAIQIARARNFPSMTRLLQHAQAPTIIPRRLRPQHRTRQRKAPQRYTT